MQEHLEKRSALYIIDGHADTPQRMLDENFDFVTGSGGHLSLAAARAGGLGAEFMVAWPEPSAWRGRYRLRTLELLGAVHAQAARHPEELALAVTADDIEEAHASGRFAMLLAVEGGHAIENSLEVLREYHALGVRYMTLTWMNSNEWADSSGDEVSRQHGGLTSFGREVVREMNRLGMMVDVSHVADQTFWHVLETTRAPVIASHSSSRALCDIPRNLSDEMLRAVATANGIVMVNFYAAFVDSRFREGWLRCEPARHALAETTARQQRERGEAVPYGASMEADRAFYDRELRAALPLPTLDTLVDHFDHVAQVAGVDHVGFGSDFDGFSMLPHGMTGAAELPKILEALGRRGYTAAQLEKMAHGNLLRVMRAVEAAATAEQAR